jgi:hypothetical protein
VPIEPTPPNPDIEEVNEQLSDGLKTCRSMVANYKALLTADQKPEPSEEPDPDLLEQVIPISRQKPA